MSTPIVLIADDSLVVRSFLRKQLAPEGFELVEADNGETALEICRSANPPDVVLLDVEMPGLSGYDVIGAMQADPTLVTIPVIFLSGRVSASDVATGLRLGAHDYLRKPVETGELIARVTHALRTKAMYARLQAEKPAADADAESLDELTGVLDIEGLQSHLRDLAVAVRNGRRLAALLLDIAALNDVNNQHGDAAGDQVLRALATVLTERVGPRDVIGRCGDDEFIVLLPDAHRGEAQALAQRVNDAVINSPALGAGALRVRVNIGVGATDDDLEGLLGDLEADLSEAKAAPTTPANPLTLPEPPPQPRSTLPPPPPPTSAPAPRPAPAPAPTPAPVPRPQPPRSPDAAPAPAPRPPVDPRRTMPPPPNPTTKPVEPEGKRRRWTRQTGR